MPDRHVTRSGDDYAEAFAALLPWGLAWPRRKDSVLMRVVRGLSQVWGLVEAKASALLERESDPRTTLDLLPDWERNWGLPDECYAEPFTIGDRQKALVQRMTIEGAQSREFFISVAAFLGYTITITEYRPFMVGIDRVGDNRELVRDGGGEVLPYAADEAWVFENTTSTHGFAATDGTFTGAGDGATFEETGANPVLRSPGGLAIDGSVSRIIRIDATRTVARSSGAWDGTIYYTTGGHGEDAAYRKIISPERWATVGRREVVEIDMSSLDDGADDWTTNTITGLRFDFDDGASEIKIFSISVGHHDPVQPSSEAEVVYTHDEYPYMLGPAENRFYWSVHVGDVRLTWFRVGGGGGQTGVDPHLLIALATDLECLLRRWKPAHTEIIFDYSGLETPGPMSGTP